MKNKKAGVRAILSIFLLLLTIGTAAQQMMPVRVQVLSASSTGLTTGGAVTFTVLLSDDLQQPATLYVRSDIGPMVLLHIREGESSATASLVLQDVGDYTFTLQEPDGQELLDGEDGFSVTVQVTSYILRLVLEMFPNPASSSGALSVHLLLQETRFDGATRTTRLPVPLSLRLEAGRCQSTQPDGSCGNEYEQLVPDIITVTIPAGRSTARTVITLDEGPLDPGIWEFYVGGSMISRRFSLSRNAFGGGRQQALFSPLCNRRSTSDFCIADYYFLDTLRADQLRLDAELPLPPSTLREKRLLLAGNISPRRVLAASAVTLTVFPAEAELSLLDQRLLETLPTSLSVTVFAHRCPRPDDQGFCGADAVPAGTYTLQIAPGEDSGSVQIPAQALQEPGAWEFTIGPEVDQFTSFLFMEETVPEPFPVVVSAPPQQISPEIYAYYGTGYITALMPVLQVVRPPQLSMEAVPPAVQAGAEVQVAATLNSASFATVTVTITASADGDSGITTSREVVFSPSVSAARAVFAPGTLGLGRWVFTAAAMPTGLVNTEAQTAVEVVEMPASIQLTALPDEVAPGHALELTVVVEPPFARDISMAVLVRAADGMRERVHISIAAQSSSGMLSYVPDATSGTWTFEAVIMALSGSATQTLEVTVARVDFSPEDALRADDLVLALRYLRLCVAEVDEEGVTPIEPVPSSCAGLTANLARPDSPAPQLLQELLVPDLTGDRRGDAQDLVLFLRYLAGIGDGSLLLPEAARRIPQHERARLRIFKQLIVK